MQRTLIVLTLLALAAGCANLEARRHASELQSMRQDDEYCVGQGLHYPDTAYLDCRYRLQNTRTYRQWKSLQMALTAARPQAMTPPPAPSSVGDFRPLDRERFACWSEPQFGGNYIFCGERDKSQH